MNSKINILRLLAIILICISGAYILGFDLFSYEKLAIASYTALALAILVLISLLPGAKTEETAPTPNPDNTEDTPINDMAALSLNWLIKPDHLQDAALLTCPEKLVLNLNRAAVEIFDDLNDGVSIVGKSITDVFDILHGHLEERLGADQLLEAVLETPDMQFREMLRLTDGRVIERTTRPFSDDGCRIWFLRDITHLEQANEERALHETMTQEDAERTAEMAEQLYLAKAELESNQAELTRLANTDGLTGLNNRRHFMELANNSLDSISSLFDVWVIMMDIDHFKKVNDTYGHSAGDTAICEFADTIKKCVGNQGEVGRMGGEEFAVVLPGVTKDDTIKIAEDIRIATETLKIEHEGNNFAFTASIGIAAVKGETTIEPALDRADAALYDAKTSGRNQIKAA